MVKSNKKIVAGTERYYGNNDLQVRGSENEIRKNYLCRQSQRYKGRRHASILKSLHLSFSPGKGSLKKQDNLRILESDGGN
jgi:hypothetical protein